MKRNLKIKGNHIKRWTACVLALYMAFSPMSPAATVYADAVNPGAAKVESSNPGDAGTDSVVHHAEAREDSNTELEDEKLEGGACESTAWAWISANGANERNPTYRFDFAGLKAGQDKYTQQGIMTTWDWRGYPTYLAKTDATHPNPPKPNLSSEGTDLSHLYKYNPDSDHDVMYISQMGVELKVKLTSSPDNKYVYVDYYLYDRSGQGGTYYLGSGADAMISGDDTATCYQNSRGFHMVSSDNMVFDCITNDPNLGITEKPDSRYVGPYGGFFDAMFNNGDSDDAKTQPNVDSGIAYSWKINLKPYETVHRRVAFAIRSTSYYVSANGNDSGEGTYSSPFKTVQHAVDRIENNKGYIYLMDNSTNLTGPVLINQGTSQDITIASTDYDSQGNPQAGTSGYIKKITANGTAFKVTGGGKLRFTDIMLDGNISDSEVTREAPMLLATGGTLEINSGTIIQNCKGTSKTVGSAVDVTDSGTIPGALALNRCTIKDNTSPQGGKGAVHFAGSGAFQADGNVVVEDNTMTGSGGQSNVYLEEGKTITVTGSLGSGDTGAKIGVTTANNPTAAPGGIVTSKEQERDVAIPEPGSVVDTSPCLFAQNFTADQAGSFIGVGTANLKDSEGHDIPGNDKRAVRRIDGYTIKFVRQEQSSQTAIQGGELFDINKGPGESVDLQVPDGIANYTLASVTIDPPSDPQTDYIKVQDDMSISGKMPPYDVTVTYNYIKQTSKIQFNSNGSDINPPTLSGNAGERVNASFPYVSRPGYTFIGWSKTNNPVPAANQIETSLPEFFEIGTVNYYAIYTPDESQKFDYTVTYKNSSGTLQFQPPKIVERAHPVETGLIEDPPTIPGYRWSSQSGTSPSDFNYAGTVGPVGYFNDPDGQSYDSSKPTGQFTGRMPAQALTLNFRYEVDAGNPDALSPFTVRYRLRNPDGTPGRDVVDPQTTQQYPEAVINAAPKIIQGYSVVGAEFTKGKGSSDLPPGEIWTEAQGTLNSPAYILENGVMPNRPVEITYYYKPAATTYGLTVQYQDKDTEDPALANILTLPVEHHPAEDIVNGSYATPYGYLPIAPDNMTDKTIVPAAALDGGIRWASGSNNFTGPMPNQAAAVTYRQNRDNNQWKTVTFQVQVYSGGETHGTLSAGPGVAGVSPDVKEKPGEPGVYTTKVLSSDGSSAGNAAAYHFSDLERKKLLPQCTPASGYVFKGWFQNPEDTETIDPAQTFPADTTLTARCVLDPNAWSTVRLAVEHGTLSEGPQISITVPNGQNWSSIADQLPVVQTGSVPPSPAPAHGTLTPEVNFVPDGWYQTVGTTRVKMTDAMPLKDGTLYTYRFKPNPDIFGTTAKTPNAQAGLNSSGEGRIKVYTYGKDIETTNYQYILTNQDGIVLAVLQGSQLGWIQFDHLYPGTRYQVYEARTGDKIYVDHPIHDSFSDADFTNPDILSAPAELLTPVVETNYTVSYDVKEDGKTVLTIRPADTDSDYALLTKDGTVVTETGEESAGGWKHPSKNPAQVSFPGLIYNEEYIVVARPKGMTGITAESKKEDGSIIITDLGGEPELKNCIVETLGGTVTQVTSPAGESMPGAGTPRYETAHKGDTVTVAAPADEDGQPFLHWELLIGPGEGIGGLEGFDKNAKTTHFTMPDTNIVLHAVYHKAEATPSNATVTDEMRGGKKGQLALAPQCIPILEGGLTTEQDRILMDQNNAQVLYKVIYQKNSVKASESDAVKDADDSVWQEDYPDGHRQAYKTIFGLTVTAERYVDGRKIGAASPADAAIRTYVQTGKDDSDMLDYRLYRIDTEDGAVQPVDLINTDETAANPEETGGLFAFDGHIGDRYVLVCSQAYRLRFINDTTVGHTANESIRVRKKEEPIDYMDSEAGIPPDLLNSWPDPMTGAFYHDPEWSYKNTGAGTEPDSFDFERPIKKDTIAYAWYYNDKKELDETREKLEQAIQHALQTGNDPFLHPGEQNEVFDLIQAAQDVLDRVPRANKEDLEDALSTLTDRIKPYEQILAERYGDYNHIQDNKPQGGSGGGGGGGGGSKKNPYGSEEPQNYQAPVNGSWEIIPGENGQSPQRRFSLNGGEPLKNIWAMLDAPEGAAGPAAAGPSAAGPAGGQGWYHFDAQGNMQTGWLCDQDGSWYYLNTDAEGDAGRMQTGFKQTPGDPYTYYLDPATGAMATGWREIDGKWYYFNPVGGNVYYYDPALQQWLHGAADKKPLGAMYREETTPDGYRVGPDGVWIQ